MISVKRLKVQLKQLRLARIKVDLYESLRREATQFWVVREGISLEVKEGGEVSMARKKARVKMKQKPKKVMKKPVKKGRR